MLKFWSYYFVIWLLSLGWQNVLLTLLPLAGGLLYFCKICKISCMLLVLISPQEVFILISGVEIWDVTYFINSKLGREIVWCIWGRVVVVSGFVLIKFVLFSGKPGKILVLSSFRFCSFWIWPRRDAKRSSLGSCSAILACEWFECYC